MAILARLLLAYIWIGVALLLLLLYEIARFYQRTSGQRSFYRGFLIPALCFLLAAGRYVLAASDFTGDAVGDLFLFGGGVILILLGHYLLRLMTGGRS